MTDSFKHKVFLGLLWRGLERFGTQLAGLAISIVLARLLTPKDFGLITLIAVFIALAHVFIGGGFAQALVRKPDVSEADYNSVFYLSLVISVLFYVLLFALAPSIAAFYGEPVLIWILRFLSLQIIAGAFNSIQTAVLMREMRFQSSFWCGIITMLVSAIFGIGMALRGYGVWALVVSNLAGQAATTVVLWRLVRWRPVLIFSWSSVRELFGFGSKLLVSGLLDTAFNNIYNFIIGKLFNPTILGYYSRGQSIPNTLMTSVNGTISSVMFPALASCQHDRERLRAIMRRMIKTTTFFVFPMMFGLAAVAKPLVLILLTEKWLPCVPFLQLSCITYAFWPLHVANLQVINALGRSDIFLTLEVVKKALIIGVIIVTFRFGVMAMVAGQAALSFASVFLNAWPNNGLVNYTIWDQCQDILPALLLSACMATCVLALRLIFAENGVLLLAQIVSGAVVYFISARMLKLESADYLLHILRQYRGLQVGVFHA